MKDKNNISNHNCNDNETTHTRQRERERTLRYREISSGISPSNIVQGKRNRRPKHMPDYYAHHTTEASLTACHASVVNATHVNDLSPPPKGYWTLKGHLKAEEFREAESAE